ncbi:MAG: hypothetical protein PHE67_05460 [Campylobacterales bacterium]|nr:hypothetical protein [Campylobacterales bacterium]
MAKTHTDLISVSAEAKIQMDIFINSYFNEIIKILEFEESFISDNELPASEIDYFKLKRFLMTAIRNLKDIDDSIFAGLLTKLQNDVFSLFDYHSKFIMQNTLVRHIFETRFLPNFEPYKNASNEEKTEITKYLMDDFIERFTKERNSLTSRLVIVTNAKAFYLDKLMWFMASKSEKIKRFFEDSAIDGYYDSATLVKYYLRHMDMEQAQNKERGQYLKEILKIVSK